MFGINFINTGKINKKYGRYLNKLKDERENGDYDIFTMFEMEDTKEAVKESSEFLEEMINYLKKIGMDICHRKHE